MIILRVSFQTLENRIDQKAPDLQFTHDKAMFLSLYLWLFVRYINSRQNQRRNYVIRETRNNEALFSNSFVNRK